MRESITEQRCRLTTASIGEIPDLEAYADKQRRDGKKYRHFIFASARRWRLGKCPADRLRIFCKRLHCSQESEFDLVTPL